MIELTAADGHTFSAYRADPAGAPKGSVVILQDALGLNPQIRKMADTFAENGYLAIAPSMFDCVKPGVALEPNEAGWSEGTDLVRKVDRHEALAIIDAAVDSARSAGKVAIVGYGWGGYLAYVAANHVSGLACAVSYYGQGIVDEYGAKRRIPILLHFGENDALIPFESVSQFRMLRPEVSAFSYPGAAHAFDASDLESYQETAAQQAFDRTLFWISQYIVGQPPVALKNSGAYAQAKVEKKKKKKEASDDLGPPMD
jgi:carboxymethylenebutenolidase